MTIASVLAKEKIVSLSELQKNPGKALDAKIVRIVKNGKEIGIFITKEEFEDFIEEYLEARPSVKSELKKIKRKGKKGKRIPLDEIL